MGQSLSEPITSKAVNKDENDQIQVAACSMQGWRIHMEDACQHKLCYNNEKDCSLFAVFDGHGGAATSQYASRYIESILSKQLNKKEQTIPEAMKSAFMMLDWQLKEDQAMWGDNSGSTAVCVLVKDSTIYCANAGDSRAIASVRGHPQLLSFDHKPNHFREKERILDGGGFVENNRVNGNLALSRAIGDFSFKKNVDKGAQDQIVTAYPDVIVKEMTPDHEFILLASDGIWDCMSNIEVVTFVREKIADGIEPETICNQLMDYCLTDSPNIGIGADNMSVVLAVLKQNAHSCQNPRNSNLIPPNCLIESYPEFVKGGISVL